MDIGGEFSGTVSGMMNMGGQFVGALSPTVFGYLVSRGSWVAPSGCPRACYLSARPSGVLDRSGQSVIDKGEGTVGPAIGTIPTPAALGNR